MKINHHNKIPEFLQQQINQKIAEVLDGYSSKHPVDLVVCDRFTLTKKLYNFLDDIPLRKVFDATKRLYMS